VQTLLSKPMPTALTREQVREIDRRAAEEFGLPGIVLMENAGRGCALSLLRQGCRGPVIICCGKGNNGGDGFVIARHLDAAGIQVKILLFADPAALRGDAAANCAVAEKSRLPMVVVPANVSAAEIDTHLTGAEWIVDALLGTGAKGNPQPPILTAIERLNASPAKTLAVDLPSGLDCDTGEPATPTILADVTCTFVARKLGFANPSAVEYLGTVEVIEIGVPAVLLRQYGLSPNQTGDM
jgi:NAD(P)H-hydrate epimerase